MYDMKRINRMTFEIKGRQEARDANRSEEVMREGRVEREDEKGIR
jgi:hypothetical protein